MEEVSTNISRRSVALGAPSALALGSMGSLAKLAPLGAVAALGAVHNSASAAAPFGKSIEAFFKFRQSNEYGWHIRSSLQGLIQFTLTVVLKKAIPVNLWTDPKVFKTTWDSFGATGRKLIMDQLPKLHQQRTAALPVAQQFLDFWKQEIRSTTTSDLMLELHTMPIALDYVMHFVEMNTTNALERARIRAAMVEHERSHDRRFLRGGTEESLRKKKGPFPTTDEYEYSPGDKRKPVKRPKPVKEEDFGVKAEVIPMPFNGPSDAIYFPSYSPESLAAHGTNSTTLEPTIAPVVSTAYSLSPSQLQAIANITSDDIDMNGPYTNQTAAESKTMLREVTEALMRMTGYFYESYLVAINICTAQAQVQIGMIRKQIGNPDNVMGLNLDNLLLDSWASLGQSPEFRAIGIAQREKFKQSFYSLCNVVYASMAFTSFYLAVAIANRGVTTKDGAVMIGQLAASLAFVSTTSLNALGYLGTSILGSGVLPSQLAAAKATIRRNFALADLTAGLVLFSTLLGGGSLATKLGASTQAITRLGTAMIGGIDFVYRAATWNRPVAPSYRAILTGKGAQLTAGVAVVCVITAMVEIVSSAIAAGGGGR